MRAEPLLALVLGAWAPWASAAEDALPSMAFLEFLGGLVEVEGELLGPTDLAELPTGADVVPTDAVDRVEPALHEDREEDGR